MQKEILFLLVPVNGSVCNLNRLWFSQELEQHYPEAQFQYCERENAKLYINIADKQDDKILFYCRVYDITEQELTLLSEKEGCHRINMDAMGGMSFEKEIARQYGYK